MRKLKWVSSHELKPGDVVDSYQNADGIVHMASWLVREASSLLITWDQWCDPKNRETISALGCKFAVPMTWEEFHNQWREQAKEVVEILRAGPITALDSNSHTMWNAWLGADAYELAQSLHDNRLKLLGWFPLDSPKYSWLGEPLDIGVAAEYPDGEKMWCHYSKEWLNDIINERI